MNRFFAFVLLLAMYDASFAQQEDVGTLHATAKTFMRQGDFSNAVLVLTRALKQSPKDLEVLKDLAFTYYLQKNYSAALETVKPLIERKDADEQCFQILGLVYNVIEERKECEKMYKQGLKRFPNSGVLYNEYGEMLWTRQDNDAIRLWEKGIEVDPNYSSNYYNACRYYSYTYDRVWCLIYGEVFVNLESYSKRTPEIKNILVESYKKLFSDPSLAKNQNTKNPFAAAYLTVLNDQAAEVAQGISPESLIALRSRFILEWFDKYAARFPFRLFEYHRQLLKEGMFDAYNQWIFGAAQNLPAFQNWTTAHNDEYARFINFQKGRIYKLPAGQYYHPLNLK
ncbi:MAG TPA: tetratricopeptide repeat protein [Puia sp.]|nr:tetratricopeptide repeat protein [Puia sp.]